MATRTHIAPGADDVRATARPATGCGAACTVRVVSTESEFDALAPAWDRLLCRSEDSVFQTFEWQRTWWEYFHDGLELRILVFETGGDVVGIAPLCVDRLRFAGVTVARQLKFIGVGVSDYLSPIVLPGQELAVLSAMADTLKTTAGEWDVFDLEDVNENWAGFPHLAGILIGRGMPISSYQGNVCPYVPLPSSSEALLGNQNYRRKLKRLKEKFSSRVELVKSGRGEIEKAVEDFSGIHGKRWESQGHPNAFEDARHRAFHVEVCRRFADRDWLRIFFLRVNDERVAVSLSFNYRSRIYMYQSNAHGPEDVMKCSPGFLVRAAAMEEGIREGVHTFDYMRGNEAYKYRDWPARETRNWLIRARTPKPTGRVRFYCFIAADFCSKAADRIRREYYEYRRFRITDRTGTSVPAYLAKKTSTLLGLAGQFIWRHIAPQSRTDTPDGKARP